MIPFRHIFTQIKKRDPRQQLLYVAAVMIFFWTIFDIILSFLAPILITERGYSNSEMGLIIAFSSISGALFDFILARYLRNSNYLRTFFLLLCIGFIFPLVLWYSQHIFVYLLAMAIWGLYYDLYTFASFDFVSRNNESSSAHARDFGIIELFRSVGGLIAPIIITVLVVGKLTFGNFVWPLLFLIAAWVFYLLLLSLSPLHHFHGSDLRLKPVGFKLEFARWRRLSRTLLPVLVFMISIYIFDATFWTIGPIYSDNFPNFPHFSGYLMTLYNLPSMITAWKVEYLTVRFGKKRTAYFSFLLGNLFLVPIGFVSSPIIVLVLVFFSAVCISITWPAIEGAFADYIAEADELEIEVEGITDLTSNIGYIIGPIAAGVFSDIIGISMSFAVLGAINFVIIMILFVTTPKSIRIPHKISY